MNKANHVRPLQYFQSITTLPVRRVKFFQVDEAIRARRAIKWYDPEHQMPEETFLELIEHAILAPTAFNI